MLLPVQEPATELIACNMRKDISLLSDQFLRVNILTGELPLRELLCGMDEGGGTVVRANGPSKQSGNCHSHNDESKQQERLKLGRVNKEQWYEYHNIDDESDQLVCRETSVCGQGVCHMFERGKDSPEEHSNSQPSPVRLHAAEDEVDETLKHDDKI